MLVQANECRTIEVIEVRVAEQDEVELRQRLDIQRRRDETARSAGDDA
jgi:hypothetical protein